MKKFAIKPNQKEAKLPQRYNMSMLPVSINFVIPGFKREYTPGCVKTLALRKRDSEEWYNEFVDRLIKACGKHFLPVCRMSDGEYLFILGEQPLDFRVSFFLKLKIMFSRLRETIFRRGGLGPRTKGHYHSGEYSAHEWKDARIDCPKKIRKISEKGILTWHLNYTNIPFQERYHPALDRWLQQHNILINDINYYPFYFVYALLTGPRRGELLKGRRVLVVNGAQEENKLKIIAGLKREGVTKVLWCQISWKRSLFDTVDMSPFVGKVDLALVGAGIGKYNILLQMEKLNVPCIDAGYIFEIWKEPENKWERVYCYTDEDCAEIGNK